MHFSNAEEQFDFFNVELRGDCYDIGEIVWEVFWGSLSYCSGYGRNDGMTEPNKLTNDTCGYKNASEGVATTLMQGDTVLYSRLGILYPVTNCAEL